jgi:hypothetical protein
MMAPLLDPRSHDQSCSIRLGGPLFDSCDCGRDLPTTNAAFAAGLRDPGTAAEHEHRWRDRGDGLPRRHSHALAGLEHNHVASGRAAGRTYFRNPARRSERRGVWSVDLDIVDDWCYPP